MRDTCAAPLLLLAEDSDDDYFLAQQALERSGVRHKIARVRDGQELLDYLQRRGPWADPEKSPRPAVILLDLNMPRKDGFEALRELKSDPCLRRIPVVIFTTARHEDHARRGFELGCNAYVEKPIGLDPLAQALEAVSRVFLLPVPID